MMFHVGLSNMILMFFRRLSVGVSVLRNRAQCLLCYIIFDVVIDVVDGVY